MDQGRWDIGLKSGWPLVADRWQGPIFPGVIWKPGSWDQVRAPRGRFLTVRKFHLLSGAREPPGLRNVFLAQIEPPTGT